jgi:PAS domain S-box-containing protein
VQTIEPVGDRAAPPAQIDFGSLFSALPSPVLVLAPDAPRFTIIDVNQAYLAATMRRREDLLGLGVFEAFPDNPDELGATGVRNLRSSLERALSSGESDLMAVQKYDIPAPDGGFEERWWDPVNTPLLDANGTVLALLHQVTDVTHRVQAEAASRQSEARLHALVDQAWAGIAQVDLNGRFTEVNDRYCDMVGRSREELLGRLMQDITHPDDLPANLPLFQAAAEQGTPFDIEKRYVRPDGSPIWVRNSVYAVRGKDGRVESIVAVSIDLTIRHAAEAAMRESEERFRNMADHAPVMMWVTDASGACTYLNRAWYEFTGQTRAEAEGFGWLDATHPDDKAEAERVFRDANVKREAFRLEYRLRRHDGVYRWAIDAASPRFGPDGAFLGYVGSVIDIDERRESEEALAINEERLRLATDAAELGFWDVDVVNDVLIWPPRVKAMFGISPDVPVSMRDFYEGLHPDDREQTAAAFAAACDPAQRALYNIEYRTVGKEDGVIRWVAAKGRALFDEEGRCTRVVGTAIDITTRKQVEERQQSEQDRIRFLAALDDALRSSRDAPAAMAAATQVVARHLGTTRCAYADVDTDAENDRFVIRSDWSAPGVPSSSGTYSLDLFGPRAAADMRQGRTLVVRNIGEELGLDEGREMFHSIGIDAIICCPLVKEGRLAAMMAVHQDHPRDWQADEIALVETVVERCWAHVERVGAEARLRESEAQFHAIANSIDQMVWSTRPDGFHDYYNDRWYEYTGVPYGSTDGEAWNGMFHPDDQDRAWAVWRHSLETGEPYHIEYRLRHRSGHYRWVIGRAQCARDESGRIIRWYGTCTDIHDLKVFETRLAESEERYRTLFTSIESGFCVAEVRRQDDGRFDYRILEANPAFYHQTGFPESILNAWLREAAPDLEEHWYETYGRVAETGEPLRFEQGSEALGRWFDVYAFRIGEPEERRVAILFNDISARRNAEEALRKLNGTLEERVAERTAELEAAHEQLRQSQKMEAMGQLTGGVAHDFNNLLTPIVGTLDLLKRKGLGGEREQRLIDGAIQSADRAKILVQRLLAFARRQPLQASAVDVPSLTRGMADLVASTTGPQIKVVVDAPDGLPAALADPNQLEMAILNLAVNARDAMPEGGTLRISVSAETVGPGNKRLRAGHYVRLSVADTGIGMDEDTLARAVEPFFSTKGIGKGTGLGLSMVHGLASQLGGTLQIHSRPGMGTNVEMWVPASEATAAQEGVATSAVEVAESGRGTALLVDDEDLVRATTADMLAELGHAVVEADSAEAALRLLDQGLRPDLIVTDHLMPGLTGTELARIAQSRLPGTRLLIVSGYADAEGIAPDLPRLIKPFGSAELAAALAATLPNGKMADAR